MEQALEFSASAARGTISKAVQSVPTPVVLLLFFLCVLLLQSFHGEPEPLLPTSSSDGSVRLVALPGPPEKGHAYLDVSARRLVFSPERLDNALERASARAAREESRRVRKYYRLKTALRQYTPMGGAVAEEKDAVVV